MPFAGQPFHKSSFLSGIWSMSKFTLFLSFLGPLTPPACLYFAILIFIFVEIICKVIFFLRIKNVLFVSNVFIVNRESIKPYGFVGCKTSCTCKSFSAQAHLRPGDFEILSKSKAWQSQV